MPGLLGIKEDWSLVKQKLLNEIWKRRRNRSTYIKKNVSLLAILLEQLPTEQDQIQCMIRNKRVIYECVI